MKSSTVVNAAFCKKLQSQTKSVIQSFGKCILLWESDSSQLALLLNELDNLNTEWLIVCNAGEENDASRLISGQLMVAIERIFGQMRVFE